VRQLGRTTRPGTLFELRLVEPPELRLDNREIIAARLILPCELQHMTLTGPIGAYLGR
jgi:8-oxo-dGTP diphosphatase